MAKAYKLTPIEKVLTPLERFEDNLKDFLSDTSVADDYKLSVFQNAIRRFDKQKPYREKPIPVSMINTSASPEKTQLDAGPLVDTTETDLIESLSRSYREPAKRILQFLKPLDTIQADILNNTIIVQGKKYNLLDLLTDLATNRKKLVALDDNFVQFLLTSNFSKSLIINKEVRKKLDYSEKIHSRSVTSPTFRSLIENTSTPKIKENKSLSVKKRKIVDSFESPNQSGFGNISLRKAWMKK